MGNKNVIPLKSYNYSNLLQSFSNTFYSEFSDELDEGDILDFAMKTWNLAIIKNEFTNTECKFNEGFEGEFEDYKELQNKMVAYKNKHYKQYNLFILDYNLFVKDGNLKLEVVTGGVEEYNNMLEDRLFEDDNFDEEADIEENFINRHAIILKPKKPFKDWVKKIESDLDFELFNIKNVKNEDEYDFFEFETKIYLIDDDILEEEEWLEENFERLFVDELEIACLNENLWPKNRSLNMFKKWFDINFSTMVYDLEKDPITKGVFE